MLGLHSQSGMRPISARLAYLKSWQKLGIEVVNGRGHLLGGFCLLAWVSLALCKSKQNKVKVLGGSDLPDTLCLLVFMF